MTGLERITPEELARRLGRDWPASLGHLLDAQAAAAGQLDALSQRQHELLESESPERLLGVLSERKVVVDRLAELIEKMQPFNAVWDAVVDATPPAERAEIVRRVESIAALIDGVNARDAEDHREMGRRRDAIASRLAGVRSGKSAVAAYGNRGASSPRFQDREA